MVAISFNFKLMFIYVMMFWLKF